MPLNLTTPIQFVKDFDCGTASAAPTPTGRYGVFLMNGEFTNIQIDQWPHGWQTLHIIARDGQTIALQPRNGQNLPLKKGVYYTLRTDYDDALLSGWRIALLVHDLPLITPPGYEAGQVYPLVRGYRLPAGGAVQYFKWTPKESGFVRLIPGTTFTTDCEHQLERYCNTSGKITFLEGMTAFTAGYEEAGIVDNDPIFTEKVYVYAGIAYRLGLRNVSQENIDVDLDISTERH